MNLLTTVFIILVWLGLMLKPDAPATVRGSAIVSACVFFALSIFFGWFAALIIVALMMVLIRHTR